MELTFKQFKTLRDMADGHLTSYASVEYFDRYTGEKLAEPRLLYVGHDRPDIFDMDWWKPLLEAGLIALPPLGGGNRCTVTLEGHKALAARRTLAPPTTTPRSSAMTNSPFDDLTAAQRLQIREAHAAAKVRVMAADLTSSTADRGQCRVCDGWYLITAKGKVRHHGAKDGSWPPRRCDGAGQLPKAEES